jgi:4-hydroxybenzoate polyprenyltransferase
MTTALAFQPAERARTYASFVRLEHTLFSLPLLAAGALSAPGGTHGWVRWAVILVAAVGARTAALALNRVIDRKLDALNPRTKNRELPSGKMRLGEAWALLLGGAAAYVAACAWLGPWYLKVAPLPLAVFAAYPYLKRFTPLCHAGVGAALALAPLAGFAAAHPDLGGVAPALWLAGFAFFWVTGFDVIYATLDEASDREQGVHSMVTWLGRARALHVSALLHVFAFTCLVLAATSILPEAAPLPVWAWPSVMAALALTGLLLSLEQRWAENVNLAFFKVNVVVGFGVLATVLLARLAAGF